MKDVLVYKDFIGSVHYSAEDRAFYGKIEGIDDLVTFEGSSVDELEIGFKTMVDEHIKDCEAEGKPVEKSYKGTLNVRLNPELHRKATRQALKKGITLNQYIQLAVKKQLESES